MPRENSFSDSDGRSLTPDLEEGMAQSPTYSRDVNLPQVDTQHAPPTNGVDSSLRSPMSAHSNARPTVPRINTTAQISPKDRFRNSVRKVIQLHRSTTVLANGGIGAEPGIDPRRDSAVLHYGHIRQNCVIEVVDYSGIRSSFGRMTNREFVQLLHDPGASAKEPWVKVRWINIGGISWDVISALALKYELHPLALEDVLHHRDHRSKADYYSKHLFLRVACHQLVDPDQASEDHIPASFDTELVDSPTSESPVMLESMKGTLTGRGEEQYEFSTGVSRNSSSNFLSWNRKKRPDLEKTMPTRQPTGRVETDEHMRKRVKQEITIRQLKKAERVPVDVKPMFMFLLRDGTVICIHPTPNLKFTNPITMRLRQRDTVLRTSADPSFLIQSLLDLIVDQAMEVVDTYHDKIREFESQVLFKTKMNTVQNLHILSGDLILHKRTLEPVKTVIYGLRRYDLDRCAALIDQSDATKSDEKVVGYMTHKSKIYLADVYDHADYIIQSLDMFTSITENLIGYTFNMASYEMNVVMRRLTLATIIFLPLTLLTGYFMNFNIMPSVQDHSDLLFWIIALPVMAAVIPMFLFADIKDAAHYMHKKVLTKKAVKNYKQA